MKAMNRIANGAALAAFAVVTTLLPAVAANADNDRDCAPRVVTVCRDNAGFRERRDRERVVFQSDPRACAVARTPVASLQDNKNEMRNLTALGAVTAAVGILTHNPRVAVAGAVGAVVADSQFQRDQHLQNQQNRW